MSEGQKAFLIGEPVDPEVTSKGKRRSSAQTIRSGFWRRWIARRDTAVSERCCGGRGSIPRR